MSSIVCETWFNTLRIQVNGIFEIQTKTFYFQNGNKGDTYFHVIIAYSTYIFGNLKEALVPLISHLYLSIFKQRTNFPKYNNPFSPYVHSVSDEIDYIIQMIPGKTFHRVLCSQPELQKRLDRIPVGTRLFVLIFILIEVNGAHAKSLMIRIRPSISPKFN